MGCRARRIRAGRSCSLRSSRGFIIISARPTRQCDFQFDGSTSEARCASASAGMGLLSAMYAAARLHSTIAPCLRIAGSSSTGGPSSSLSSGSGNSLTPFEYEAIASFNSPARCWFRSLDVSQEVEPTQPAEPFATRTPSFM